MKYHVLVVDDSQDVLDDVKDRLESLGHSCDCATSLQNARDHLARNSYSYVLLDLEIPVRYGRPSRIANGQNLLREIRAMKGYQHIPIIVMTSHGHDSPDLAVEALRVNGATDYIKKPFPEKGHTLEKAVKDAVRAAGRDRPGAATLQGAEEVQPPQSFQEGDMVFFADRVELCGVKVCGDGGLIRRILDELKQTGAKGDYVRCGGEDLARRVGCDRGQNGVAECIRDFRDAACQALRDQANIACDRLSDIIQNDRRYGYRLSKKIVVRESHDPINGPDDPQNDPVSDPVNDPLSGILNERQEWAMKQLAARGKVRSSEIAGQFGCSATTAKRDMKELRRMGKVEFYGPPRTGHWRLKLAESA
jgi:CheY-like chemotaxis protein